MAALAGYAVTVIDPRRAFADARALSRASPSRRLAGRGAGRALKPDARTAVVTLTHDPKLDDPGARRGAALARASTSARSAARRRTPRGSSGCASCGFGEAELARIHGPVGLDIGARRPAEIAVSILAQITAGAPRAAARGMKIRRSSRLAERRRARSWRTRVRAGAATPSRRAAC